MDEDLGEVMGCTCLRLRRVARRMTQIYDHGLEPSGLTVNQFGLLAHLFGAAQAGAVGWPIGRLSERLGMDPTTLNRNLKPLQSRGLVEDAVDPADRRIRLVRLTPEGERRWRAAVPLWRQAQTRVDTLLGDPAVQALNELLDLSSAKLPTV